MATVVEQRALSTIEQALCSSQTDCANGFRYLLSIFDTMLDAMRCDRVFEKRLWQAKNWDMYREPRQHKNFKRRPDRTISWTCLDDDMICAKGSVTQGINSLAMARSLQDILQLRSPTADHAYRKCEKRQTEIRAGPRAPLGSYLDFPIVLR